MSFASYLMPPFVPPIDFAGGGKRAWEECGLYYTATLPAAQPTQVRRSTRTTNLHGRVQPQPQPQQGSRQPAAKHGYFFTTLGEWMRARDRKANEMLMRACGNNRALADKMITHEMLLDERQTRCHATMSVLGRVQNHRRHGLRNSA